MEAVILAGGLGTRLRSVVSNIPKPMAPISGRPFLSFILEYLACQQVSRVILATGFQHNYIESFFGHEYKGISIVYSKEEEPLGTGGALKQALGFINNTHVIILNGDTFFNVNLNNAIDAHFSCNADLTICLKPMKDFDRYGVVVTSGNKVATFEEKKYREFGNINGGVYIANTNLLKTLELRDKFSFETDFLAKFVNNLYFNAHVCDDYFIDIGIPEDYQKAQIEISNMFAFKEGY